MGNFPRWFWWVISIVLIIVVCVLLKFNISVGSNGIHATQGLIQ